MTTGTAEQMRRVAVRLDRMTAELRPAISDILLNQGVRMEVPIKRLTPVDTGALMGANRTDVTTVPDGAELTVSNRMVYAHYQHENVLRHRKTGARDHFISIPFEEAVPRIVTAIGEHIIKEARL